MDVRRFFVVTVVFSWVSDEDELDSELEELDDGDEADEDGAGTVAFINFVLGGIVFSTASSSLELESEPEELELEVNALFFNFVFVFLVLTAGTVVFI